MCLLQIHDPNFAKAFHRNAVFEKVRSSGAEIVNKTAEQPSGTRKLCRA